MAVRRRFAWIAVTLAAAGTAFGLGYWLATGGIRALPEAVRPFPPATPQPAVPGDQAEPEEGGYRIRIMEETDADARGAAEENKPVVPSREERGDAVILRRPAGKASLAVVVDASASAARAGESVAADQRTALESLAAAPGFALSARTMGGEAGGDCGDSRLLLQPDEERGRAPADWDDTGPRNVSRAMYLAAGDLANRRGKKGVVVVSTGDEECREWPCETARALLATTDRIRTWTVFYSPRSAPPRADGALVPVPEEADGGTETSHDAGKAAPADPGDESITSAGEEAGDNAGLGSRGEVTPSPSTLPETFEEVVVPDSLLCMGKAGGGTTVVARDPSELAKALARVAEDLSGNLTVRLFRGPGMELTGESDPQVSPWGVEVESLAGTLPAPATGSFLPAGFGLPPGRYRVRGTWGEAVATVDDLQVSAGEEVEVQLSLNAGRLMVFEGRRPWPPGLGGCRPLVSVKPPVAVPPPPADGQAEAPAEGGGERVLPEPAPGLPPEVQKCGLPATFVLPPGRWEIAVSGGNAAPRSTEVVVEAGRTVILSSSPGDPLQTVGVDKDQGSH